MILFSLSRLLLKCYKLHNRNDKLAIILKEKTDIKCELEHLDVC